MSAHIDPADDPVSALTALASVPLTHADIHEALGAICEIAVRAVPPAVGASVTSFTEGGPKAVAASDRWAAELDELQHREKEGPCLDAARTGLIFRVRSMPEEPRWPSYAPLAAERGVGSMVSLPLNAEAKTIGALNLYSGEVDAFDAATVSVAEIVAGHASLATQVTSTLFHHKAVGEQLREAMASRAAIEQAKGIVMATSGCGADEAFEVLKQQSQHENRKLREVAEDLVQRQRRR